MGMAFEPVILRGAMSLVDDQKAYINHLVRVTGRKRSTIATEAGLDASTLSNFMNQKRPGQTLTTSSIAALETRWGWTLDRGKIVRVGGAESENGFREAEASPFVMDEGTDPRIGAAVRAIRAGSNGIDAWTLHSRALEAVGYFPGDVLIVDLNGLPTKGKVVCAQIMDWEFGKDTETVFRVFEPPALVAAPVDSRLLRPYVIDHRVVVKGTVLAMIRPGDVLRR